MTAQRIGDMPVRGVLQRACACGGGGSCAKCADGELARSATGPEPDSVPAAVHDTLRSPGRPLDEGVRADAEVRLGHDLRDIRIHADSAAADAAAGVHANAFTVGRDVVFGSGRFQPGTPDGRKLLLHELTHTVQQRGGGAAGGGLRVGASGTAAEVQADRVAGGSVVEPAAPTPTAAASVVQRQPDQGGINLGLREDGRVEITVVGPKAPVIGEPALGLRRRPDGTIEFVFGASSRVLTPAEVPGLLRGALRDSSQQAPGSRGALPERMPTCADLRAPDGSVKPWVEHRVEAVLQRRQPLPRPFYEGLAAACPAPPAEEPVPGGPEPAGPESMPVADDEAMA